MLRSQFFVFALLLVFANLKLTKQKGCGGSPNVTIAQGTLRGRRNVTAQGTEYYMFLGIPYAAPPVGRLRFVAPQPPRRWQGVEDAVNFGSPCNQLNDSNVNTGNEDCLFINVFTPKLPCRHTTLLPVMVWIHGGGFVSGSGDIDPGHLLDRGVAVASFNYRLNVFGFLSVEGTEAPGNAGLKDQVAALRWVRRNIAHFGGDPHSVTIFGESAGGSSVHYHMLSLLSRGLFQRAISQSASALSPWAFNCSSQHNAYRLSYIVGRGANNTQDLVANLRATPARELIGALSNVLSPEESTRILSFPFMPTMEFHRAGERPFLLQSPECIESAGSFYKVPYIIGVNLKEGALFTPETVVSQPSYWQNISNDIEQIVPLNLGLKKGSRLSLEVAGKIKEFYFGSKDLSYENRNLWVELQSDLLFVLGVLTTLRSHARFSDFIKTYNYHFIYNNATHTDELKYVFFSEKISGGNANESIVAEHFGRLWTRFAKKGVPTSGDVFSWPPVSKNTYPFLQISTLLKLGKNLENERINFWTSIYRNYRQIGACCS